MVISSSGQVLTNNHVIDGSHQGSPPRSRGAGTVYTAKVVGTDPTADVALIQLEGVSGMKTVKIGRRPPRWSSAMRPSPSANALNLPGSHRA